MKFSCLQENLSKSLQTVSKAVPVKGSLPILTNILFEAKDGKLKLSATNLETAITTYVPCSIDNEGAITVPAKLLRDFITNLPAGPITAELKGQILQITSNKTKSKFNGISAEEFPALPSFPENVEAMELDPKVFNDAVSYVAFAASTDDSRPLFTGIFLNYQSGVLTVAATDGFRLSEKIIKTESKVKDFSAVIPAKTLLEVARTFSSSKEQVQFILNDSENLALFRSEDTTIAARIIDGQYPDYKKIIPSDMILNVSFPTHEFLEAVKLTNVFAKENDSLIKVRFDPENGIRITSLAEEAGEHESNVAAEVEGEMMEIAFSSKYLLDYLNNVKTETILFSAKGNVSPGMFKSDELEDFLHIIMPRQI